MTIVLVDVGDHMFVYFMWKNTRPATWPFVIMLQTQDQDLRPPIKCQCQYVCMYNANLTLKQAVLFVLPKVCF